MHQQVLIKEAMNLKESKEGNIRGSGEGKGNGETCNYPIIPKIKGIIRNKTIGQWTKLNILEHA